MVINSIPSILSCSQTTVFQQKTITKPRPKQTCCEKWITYVKTVKSTAIFWDVFEALDCRLDTKTMAEVEAQVKFNIRKDKVSP